ncbi:MULTISPECIES: hypothetical protein [unclassified Streptomyces]|uniref:hypothetical protein n=1 Tax=unclassified Streptomyces TaxID=2593676 RepID=UPI0033173F57
MARDPGRVAHRSPAHEPDPSPPSEQPRTDYSGAVYGSLLAASVVAGAGAFGPHPRVELVALLLCTGLVFWAAHAYIRFIGNRLRHRSVTWREIRQVCAGEWPIVQAAFLPAFAVAVSPLLGLGIEGAGWLALGVAVVQQVGWATAMVIRAGVSHGAVASVAAVNLVLGLIIVAAKVALH